MKIEKLKKVAVSFAVLLLLVSAQSYASVDTDGDGLADEFELSYPTISLELTPVAIDDIVLFVPVKTFSLDPHNPADAVQDTDGDGLPDYYEHTAEGLNYQDAADVAADFDNDGLTNGVEYSINTNINSRDSDGDTIPDGWEHNNGLNPLVSDVQFDNDNDGLNNAEEYRLGTAINNADTDGDGLSDGYEANYRTVSFDLVPIFVNRSRFFVPTFTFSLSPLDANDATVDTDGDGIYDYYELITDGLDYLNAADAVADFDNDGLDNKTEYLAGYDINAIDSDGDGFTDYWEEHDSYYAPAAVHEGTIRLTPGLIADADILHVRPPNASGISVNYFDSFDVTQKKLIIDNIPRDTTTEAGQAAGLIVIIADQFLLENTIELMGPATDILLIASSSDGIQCTNCGFNNFQRITMAVSDKQIADNASLIGNILPLKNGFEFFNGLSAPGALAVELVADNVVNNGLISTHLNASSDIDGNLVEDPAGTHTIGTGVVNLVIGPITWNYDQQAILAISPEHFVVTDLKGSIRASSVEIATVNAIVIRTTIDTRTELLSSSSYKGSTYVPREGIKIQALREDRYDHHILGQLFTDGVLDVRTSKNIVFPDLHGELNIDARKALIMAKGNITNLGNIRGGNIELIADNISNDGGEIEGLEKVTLIADLAIDNRLGGKILGDEISLKSTSGIVRNGMRTPYSNAPGSEVSLVFSPADLDVEAMDPLQIGTYYREGVNVPTTGSSSQIHDDLSAHIIGNDITVEANAFENINPYWEVLDPEYRTVEPSNDQIPLPNVRDAFVPGNWTSQNYVELINLFDDESGLAAAPFKEGEGVVSFNSKYVNQVLLSAEKKLAIKTGDYILNSSAKMAINEEDGFMNLQSAYFINERYRTEVILDYLGFRFGTTIDSGNNAENHFQNFHTNNFVNSPPGVVVSFGDFYTKASSGFLNNTGYFEIFGNALFETGTLIQDVGLEYGAIGKKISLTGSLGGVSGLTLALLDNEFTTNGKERDSLFFVHGDAKGPTLDLKSEDYSPIDYFVQYSKDVARFFTTVGLLNSGKHDVVLEPEEWQEGEVRENYVIDWTAVDTATGAQVSGTKNFTLMGLLEFIYGELKQKISDIVAEFDWWGEE